MAWCQQERAKHTDLPDDAPKPAVLNAQLKPLLHELGAERGRRAYQKFLGDSYAREKCTPPFPWGLFIRHWATKYRPKPGDSGPALVPVVGPDDDPYAESA